MSHFTQESVEKFVNENASGWGTQNLLITMTWGYRKHLEANVVALVLRSSSSQMAVTHQAIVSGSGRPTLVRKDSPPLGIPLAAMTEMKDAYSRYVQDIVKGDLAHYLAIAYDDQRSELPVRLLGAICTFYSTGLADGEEVIPNICVSLGSCGG